MFELVSFVAIWVTATVIIENNNVMRHFCDEMYWQLKRKENR